MVQVFNYVRILYPLLCIMTYRKEVMKSGVWRACLVEIQVDTLGLLCTCTEYSTLKDDFRIRKEPQCLFFL